jgi:hypothetical protein
MKIKKTLYVQLIKTRWNKEHEVSIHTFKRSVDNTLSVVNIKEIEVEIDVPELDGYDYENLLTSKLEEEKQALINAHIDRMKVIDEQIADKGGDL